MFKFRMTVNGATLRDRHYSSDMKAISDMRDEFVSVVGNGAHTVLIEVQEEDGRVISRLECEGERIWVNRGL